MGFRGSDEVLEGEIAAVEAIARVRLRRIAREMKELDRELRELKRERARRRAASGIPASSSPVESAGAESG